MMKLTFQLAHTVERIYDALRVVIGLDSPDLTDIPMNVSSLQVDHLVILDSDGEFWAFNQTNDPFVTINGRPFGRKILRNGDRLMIGEVAIAFEGEAQSTANTVDPVAPIAAIVPLLARKIREAQQPGAASPVRIPHTNVVKANVQGASSDDERELLALLEEVDRLSPLIPPKVPPQASEKEIFNALLSEAEALNAAKIPDPKPADAPIVHKSSSTSKPKVGDASPTTARSSDPIIQKAPPFSWNIWLALAAATLLLISLVFIAIAAAFSEQSDQQEYIAAQSVSDIAMALTYAQIHQLKPQNQNWTDPDFIHANLERVLNGRFGSSVVIDAQGYLRNSPYILRIYTSQDASQFLLLAQPTSSLWQWFTRRDSIILDSTAMELRRTNDLRALNRLMASPNALAGSNALEVSRLVREADLISLKTLAREIHHREFLPPRELKSLRPGAENFVHNAPRYYRLGEPMLDTLSETAADDTATLQTISEQLQRFHRLSRLVLYTNSDRAVATEAYQALMKHFPKERMLVGFLTFDAQTGAYVSSQLLSEEFTDPLQNFDEVVR